MLDNGLVRQYSLCGDPTDLKTWTVGILRDPNSRGGSEFVHDNLDAGRAVRVRGPRNHFALIDSPRYLFVAGGIGITPIKAMAQAAQRSGAQWTLIYLGRSRSTMAFADELVERYGARVILWPDAESGGTYDLAATLGTPLDDTLVYCCGPEGLLTAVENLCAAWPVGSVNVERFAARTSTPSAREEGGETLDTFEVICMRSGVTVEVDADTPMLDALEDADIPIMSSCGEGVCGTCRATVLEGIPDHRDSLLTEAERASGTTILPCVSRSKTAKLVLDL
ncbi:PDR/VanB family oxidoreductase [Gordonia asplenii]|uniref:PDR/VanB family oxidoreductase n=1 Tax=Gordonia asplenii TaxID=2725283 RepID=UPI0028A6BC9B|nr:PDR/VanB family oxidoreductase [Gordonia asplenii]